MSLICMYTGRRGAGKTLTMVKDAYLHHEEGWQVITNMHTLTFGEFKSNEEIISLIENDEIENCILVIDEIQLLIDSRRSMRKGNLDLIYFVQQSRKRNVTILSTTQYARRVDIGFREHLDVEIRPEIEYIDDSDTFVVTAEYIDLTASYEGVVNSVLLAYDPTPIFKLYDTDEKIDTIKSD